MATLDDIAKTLSDLKATIKAQQDLIKQIADGVHSIDTKEEAKNPALLSVGKKRVPTPGTAEKLPDMAIPEGMKVVIKAIRGNTNDIYLATSPSEAVDHSVAFILDGNEEREIEIDNLGRFWIDADTANDGIQWLFVHNTDY